MILIRTDGGKTVDFPSSWDELKPKQVRCIWRMQDRCLRSGASPLEFSSRVLLYLLGIRPSRNIARNGRFCENIYLLCEQCLGFMFSSDGATLRYSSTVNPMPNIGLRRGPGELLQKLTFREFRNAVVAMQTYAGSRDISDLDECIAVLYRSPCLKTNRAGRRASVVGGPMFRLDLALTRRMAPWRKSLILAWFCSTLQYLQSARLIIDGELVDMSLLFSSPGGSRGPELGWSDLLVQLARDGLLGNIDRVDEEPVLSIFSIMWSNYKEAKRYEEARKTKRRQ